MATVAAWLTTTKLGVVRYHPDGTPDLTFNLNATGGLQPDLQAGGLIDEETPGQSLFGMVRSTDQKIIVAGTCKQPQRQAIDFAWSACRRMPASTPVSMPAATRRRGDRRSSPFYNVASRP